MKLLNKIKTYLKVRKYHIDGIRIRVNEKGEFTISLRHKGLEVPIIGRTEAMLGDYEITDYGIYKEIDTAKYTAERLGRRD